MPSRTLSLVIIVFWLATMGWMFQREILPRWNNQPEPFRIDLEDEVGAHALFWSVLQDGKDIGYARTEIRRRPDRNYDLKSEFRFDGLRILSVPLRKLENQYTITSSGEMKELSITLKFGGTFNVDVALEGPIHNGFFQPRLLLDGAEIKDNPLLKFEPVPLRGQGSVLNPMHPLNKIAGLRAGQHWTVPYVQPMAAAAVPLGGQMKIGHLEASVTSVQLMWQRVVADCWLIEYAEPGKKATARTWVRQQDDLVLQQEAGYQGLTLILVRQKK